MQRCAGTLDVAGLSQSGLCVTATVAQGSDNQELWAGNQPIPALSNTRGSLQITIESGDALAVGCVYFPPFFSTCDGSRSDSRNPNSPVDATPTFAGVVQNTRVNGRPARVVRIVSRTLALTISLSLSLSLTLTLTLTLSQP